MGTVKRRTSAYRIAVQAATAPMLLVAVFAVLAGANFDAVFALMLLTGWTVVAVVWMVVKVVFAVQDAEES